MIEQEFKKNVSLNWYHTNSLKVPDDYNSNSVRLAYHFETFIDDHLKTKAQMRTYVSLSNAVGKAHEEYKACVKTISLGEELN